MTDEQLDEAWEMRGRLLQFARKLLAGRCEADAEDIVQLSFLAVVARPTEVTNVTGLMFLIVRRACRNWLALSGNKVSNRQPLEFEPTADPDYSAIIARLILAKLDARQVAIALENEGREHHNTRYHAIERLRKEAKAKGMTA